MSKMVIVPMQSHGESEAWLWTKESEVYADRFVVFEKPAKGEKAPYVHGHFVDDFRTKAEAEQCIKDCL